MLDHLGCLPYLCDMTIPKHVPREMPFLYAEDEELEGPKERPRTMSEVSGRTG